MFKKSLLHHLLRVMISTKYTQKFRLFHLYGDIYALLITFMGTWMFSKFIIFTSNQLFKKSLRHHLLWVMISTKYTQKFRLFHLYGDIYALLITFKGTWMSSKFIVLTSNSDSNSTKWKCRQNIYLLSKQPIVQKKFASSSLTSYDKHQVYTEISSHSPLWGHLCPFNHLYGNMHVF